MKYNKKLEYKFPVGDFLSGFSEDENNPCDYELECQKMVIRGVQYIEQNPEIFNIIGSGLITISDKKIKPMIEYMCHPQSGQTGLMVHHTIIHSYNAYKMGWDEYIQNFFKK